jgi:nicotinamidase/pyrazinamidase
LDIIDVSYGKQQLWPDHCLQNTDGAAFVEELNSQCFNKIIQKGTNPYIDSYSGFFENDGITATQLDLYLRSENIKEILVVGLALDYCVAYTAVDAAKLGYKVSIDLNATRSINPDIKSLLEKFEKLNINLIR